MLGLGKEVVARVDPRLDGVVGVRRGNASVAEEFSDDLTGCHDIVRQHIGRLDRRVGGGDVPTVTVARLDQSLDHGAEERTTSA